jgi:hypothetical protein
MNLDDDDSQDSLLDPLSLAQVKGAPAKPVAKAPVKAAAKPVAKAAAKAPVKAAAPVKSAENKQDEDDDNDPSSFPSIIQRARISRP